MPTVKLTIAESRRRTGLFQADGIFIIEERCPGNGRVCMHEESSGELAAGGKVSCQM